MKFLWLDDQAKHILQLLCVACVVALRVTDDESRRVFHYLRNRSREWSLLNNVTWGSIGTCDSWTSSPRCIKKHDSYNSFPDFRVFRRCSCNGDLRRIHHNNDGTVDRRGHRGTPRSKDGNCFLFLMQKEIRRSSGFRNTVNTLAVTVVAW